PLSSSTGSTDGACDSLTRMRPSISWSGSRRAMWTCIALARRWSPGRSALHERSTSTTLTGTRWRSSRQPPRDRGSRMAVGLAHGPGAGLAQLASLEAEGGPLAGQVPVPSLVDRVEVLDVRRAAAGRITFTLRSHLPWTMRTMQRYDASSYPQAGARGQALGRVLGLLGLAA